MAGTMVQFPANGHTTDGYLATPASGKGPGVLVIQEWWGLLALFAGKDGFGNPGGARGVEAAITKAGKPVEIHIYPGVDHAFVNDERPDAYSKTAAEDAWKRTVDHFKKHLK